MGAPWRTGWYDGDGHPPHGSIICSWIACSDMLLNRRRHGCAFLIDVWHAGGRRYSDRRCYSLFGRSAFRRNFWRSRGNVPCSSRWHPEEDYDRSNSVCRNPESTDPCDDPHTAENGDAYDLAMVRWLLRHASDYEHCSWGNRGVRATTAAPLATQRRIQ